MMVVVVVEMVVVVMKKSPIAVKANSNSIQMIRCRCFFWFSAFGFPELVASDP
jgi:hypothetical protein